MHAQAQLSKRKSGGLGAFLEGVNSALTLFPAPYEPPPRRVRTDLTRPLRDGFAQDMQNLRGDAERALGRMNAR